MKRLLVKYSKSEEAAFLSHREAMRAFERALRRSGIPLAFTEGYSPRPRISYSPALPLGVAAEAEYLEVTVNGEVDNLRAREKMNRALPRGLKVREVQVLAPNIPRLSRWTRYGLYRVADEGGDVHLMLALVGEGQGRLKDALEAMAAQTGGSRGRAKVTRIGLYASTDEVVEDVQGKIYYYDGGVGELKELKVEGK